MEEMGHQLSTYSYDTPETGYEESQSKATDKSFATLYERSRRQQPLFYTLVCLQYEVASYVNKPLTYFLKRIPTNC